MKILLGNNSLSILAGSETWTYTLATTLKKMGHNVGCYAPSLGIISEKLEQEGIRCFDNMATGVKPFSFVFEEKIEHKYDVIIANHNHIVDYLRLVFPVTPIISTVHGIIHFMDDGAGNKVIAPEHPALEGGVNQFISVSEEIQDKLSKDYNIDSIIIRNFFDLEKFNIKKKINKKPQQFLVNSNYHLKNDPEIELIREVSKHYGARLTAVGMNFNQTFETIKAIEDADIVVGMGRSVLEGVAAGRLGIVHGRWGTGGVICEENIEDLRRFNFSGRNSKGKMATKDELIAQIDKYYSQETIDWGKKYVSREHNSVLAADQYLAIARELTGQIINKKPEVPLRPYRRAKDVARIAKN